METESSTDGSTDATLIVSIFSIDPSKKTAIIQTDVVLQSFPENATEIIVTLKGRERIQISCNSTDSNNYVGNTSLITWYLEGWGETYPFDYYYLDLSFENTGITWKVGNNSSFINQNFTFNDKSTAIFIGSEAEPLMDSWQTKHANVVPIVPFQNRAIVTIARNYWPSLLTILLPILLSFYVLGMSIFVDRKNTDRRLTVYFSLFLFAASFFFAIQYLLPYRSTLSIPEFLLIALMTENMVFIALSIVPVRTEWMGLVLDAIALLISIILFLVLYLILLFSKINQTASLFILSIELIAFILPVLLLLIRLRQLHKKGRALEITYVHKYRHR